MTNQALFTKCMPLHTESVSGLITIEWLRSFQSGKDVLSVLNEVAENSPKQDVILQTLVAFFKKMIQ